MPVNAKHGGTLLSRYLDPPHFDQNRTTSCVVYTTMGLTNSKLVEAKSGGEAHPYLIEIEGDLAESWESNPELTEFTFHLRKNIKTHNVDPTFGRQYTSEDVRVSAERYRAGGAQADVFSAVTNIAAPDADTVVFTLSGGSADFPYIMSDYHLSICPAKAEGGILDALGIETELPVRGRAQTLPAADPVHVLPPAVAGQRGPHADLSQVGQEVPHPWEQIIDA